LVDDEDNLRRLLSKLLKSGGFDVIDFTNSPEALSWSEGNDIDVLVTDVTLSDIDGGALARAMIERNPELLVVFISGFELETKAELQSHPYCAYLEKPFPPRALLQTIGELDEQRRSRNA
jgi:two-component system cell cycle sensor histidine kinase/response regulator CckA